MSSLGFIEKEGLEELLQMKNGSVLGFTNRSFKDFVYDSTGKDIYAEEYNHASGSKANRLRAFWQKEPDHIVGRLISDLLESYQYSNLTQNTALLEKGVKIRDRLLKSSSIAAIEAIEEGEEGFEILAREVRAAIENDQPVAGLDRLHTYVTQFIRSLLRKRGVTIAKTKPLNSIFGEYVQLLQTEGLIKSEMTKQILKAHNRVLEAFNQIRNEQSLAHADAVLVNYHESLLIFDNVSSLIRFIRSLEDQPDEV